jgi:hypothetical protein
MNRIPHRSMTCRRIARTPTCNPRPVPSTRKGWSGHRSPASASSLYPPQLQDKMVLFASADPCRRQCCHRTQRDRQRPALASDGL